MEIKEISEVKVNGETASIPIQLAEDQVFGYHEVADKIRKNAATAASLEKQLDAYNDMWYDESLYGYETTNSYSVRETANGSSVIDGSKARLKKVIGNTEIGKNLCKPFSMRSSLTITEGGNTSQRDWSGSKYAFRWSFNNYMQSIPEGDYIKFSEDGNTVYFKSSSDVYGIGFDIICCPGQKYQIKIYDMKAENGSPQIMYSFFTTDKTYISGTAVTGNSITTSVAPDNAMYLVAGIRPHTAKDYEISFNQISIIQVEEDTEAIEYEPYFGGLKHITFGGIRSTGKNLCKPMSQRTHRNIGAWKVPRKWDGQTIALDMSPNYHSYNTSISINGDYVTFKPKNGSGYGMSFDMPCIVGKTYTISVGYSSVNWRSNYGTYDKDGNIKRSGRATTVTINEEEVWLVWCIAPVEQNTEITVGDIQVEYGDTATKYEPYKEFILDLSETELPRWTKIDFENKKIIRQSHTYSFTGEEDFSLNPQASNNNWGNVYMTSFSALKLPAAANGQCICSHFPTGRWASDFENGKTNFCTVTSAVILFKTDGEQDLDSFKSFLKSQAANNTPVTLHWKVSESNKTYTILDTDTNEYTVWRNGSEQIINENEGYGVFPTLTQDYLIVKQEENN